METGVPHNDFTNGEFADGRLFFAAIFYSSTVGTSIFDN